MKKAKRIAIGNQKGGAGKTTTAINLAAGLVKNGKKVLVLDIDPQGNATIGIGVDKNDVSLTIYDCLIKGIPLKEAIISTSFEGLDLIPANTQLSNAETELINKMQRESVLKKLLDKESLDYDYIIIDCPPSLGNLTVNSLVATETVLIPVEAAEYCMDATGEFMATFCLVKENVNTDLEIEGVLLTKVNPRTNAFKDYSTQLKEIFGSKVYDFHISRSQKVEDSTNFKNFSDKKAKPVVFAFPDCKSSIEYMALAKEVISNE